MRDATLRRVAHFRRFGFTPEPTVRVHYLVVSRAVHSFSSLQTVWQAMLAIPSSESVCLSCQESPKMSLPFPGKDSFSCRSVFSRTGCCSSRTGSLRRTRRGFSFFHKMATRPLLLATSCSFPVGDSMVCRPDPKQSFFIRLKKAKAYLAQRCPKRVDAAGMLSQYFFIIRTGYLWLRRNHWQ